MTMLLAVFLWYHIKKRYSIRVHNLSRLISIFLWRAVHLTVQVEDWGGYYELFKWNFNYYGNGYTIY